MDKSTDRNVCVMPIVPASSRVRNGRAVCPATLKRRLHSADIGELKTSREPFVIDADNLSIRSACPTPYWYWPWNARDQGCLSRPPSTPPGYLSRIRTWRQRPIYCRTPQCGHSYLCGSELRLPAFEVLLRSQRAPCPSTRWPSGLESWRSHRPDQREKASLASKDWKFALPVCPFALKYLWTDWSFTTAIYLSLHAKVAIEEDTKTWPSSHHGLYLWQQAGGKMRDRSEIWDLKVEKLFNYRPFSPNRGENCHSVQTKSVAHLTTTLA